MSTVTVYINTCAGSDIFPPKQDSIDDDFLALRLLANSPISFYFSFLYD